MPGKRQVILFGRYPAPGRTKTRLIPVLGEQGAAQPAAMHETKEEGMEKMSEESDK